MLNKIRTLQLFITMLVMIQFLMAQTSYLMSITKNSGSILYFPTNRINNIVFKEGGTVTDVDGNIYMTVKIGDQWWMAENLKVTHYRDGTEIPNVTDNGAWAALSTDAYCYYDNEPDNIATYGCLYNWYAVENSNIAPQGWHVPTKEEWATLITYLESEGYTGTPGLALKSTTGWRNDLNGKNIYGFNSYPAPHRIESGPYRYTDYYAYYWFSSEDNSDPSKAWYGRLYYKNNTFVEKSTSKIFGYSIRCVKDMR